MKFDRKVSFTIISYKANRWIIETELGSADLDEMSLIDCIRQIKQDLSEKVSVPPPLLFFQNILGKEKTENGLKVRFDIIRKKIEGGNPVVRFDSIKTPEGITFEKMVALIDIFYVDQFDNMVTFDRIIQEIENAGIKNELVDFKDLEQTFFTIQKTQQPVRNKVISRGQLPEIGSPAAIEYSFNAEHVKSKLNNLMGTTKVFQGDVLCTVIPPTIGQKAGFDATGKIIPPLKGTPLELIPGSGTELSPDGLNCIALIDGVVTIRKSNKTVRDEHGFDRIVIQYTFSIEPIRMVDGQSVKELKTDEHLEITGDLAENAVIVTKGKVFIDGKILDGASIQSMDGMVVTGSIQHSQLQVSGDLLAEGDVSDSDLSSDELIELKGTSINSNLSGRVIIASKVQGGTIKAKQRVDIGRIVSNLKTYDDNFTKVEVEAKEFFKKEVDESESRIQEAASSLKKIIDLLGPELTEDVGVRPAHIILLRFIALEKKRGKQPYTQKQITAIKRLIEAAEPLTDQIDTKRKIIDEYKKKIAQSGEGKSIVSIRETIQAPVEIVMGDQKKVLKPGDQPQIITYDDEKGEPDK